MITKNGGIILASRATSGSVSGGLGLKNISGESIATNYSTNLQITRSNNFETSSANTGVVMNLGTGGTAPSVDDYWLDEPLTSDDYYCSNPSVQGSPGGISDGRLIYTFSFHAKTNFTIQEICLSNLNGNGKVMFARTVIPARQVAAGEDFTFSYVVKFN